MYQSYTVPLMKDTVFEDRNKLYGAYVLREKYYKIMARAMASGSLFFISPVSSLLIYNHFKSPTIVDQNILSKSPVVILQNHPSTEKVKPVAIPQKKVLTPSKRQIQFVRPVVVREDSISAEKNLPSITELKGNSIRNATIDNISHQKDEDFPIDISTINEVIAIGNKSEIFNSIAVQQQPEFPNGISAMYTFLQTHLQYPKLALEKGIEGTVHIKCLKRVQFPMPKLSLVQEAN